MQFRFHTPRSTVVCVAYAPRVGKTLNTGMMLLLLGCSSSHDTYGVCSDAGSHPRIHASDYDQSCTTNADCVSVGEGDGCFVCPLGCPLAAINRADKARYDADVSSTPAGKNADPGPCRCEPMGEPCCHAGACSLDFKCATP